MPIHTNLTSQPPTESLVSSLQGTERNTGLDLNLLAEISAYFASVRKKYVKFESGMQGVDVRVQKGETSPAVGWYGVLGEYPAWDVTLASERALPARLDVVLWPLAPGETGRPSVQRLLVGPLVTAFRIVGEGIDDTFVLCEEGAGAVTVGDLTFEGRALLLRRQPALRALAVDPVSIAVNGEGVQPE